MPMPSGPATLQVLQAMQSILQNEVRVAGVSPFAALSASDQARFGVTNAIFIGRPKDFKDAYLPQCNLWVPSAAEAEQQVELVGYAGRVFDSIEVVLQAFVDMRTDWYAGEQRILQIRDALWPVVLRHLALGGTVPTVTESDAIEGRGLCYEQVAGVEYRCFELIWLVRQQWNVQGGKQL